MSRIPQHFIDEVIARTDIVEVITHRVPLKKAGREFKACCPFHDEKSPSFTVSPAKQFYHCFGCGEHGTAIGFLMAYERLTFVESIEELAGALGMDVPTEASAPRPSDDLYDVLARASEYFIAQLKTTPDAVAYLKQRGVSGEIAKDYGIGYAPDLWDGAMKALGQNDVKRLVAAGLIKARDDNSGYYDRFRGRVMFPIRDHRGRVVAFGGRAMTDNGPKYLNSPETEVFHKGRELYGLYEARQSRVDLSRLLVVEGYMDVVGLAQFGVRNCVATLGTATTSDHLKRLFRIAGEVVFCFDGDRAGRKAAWRALNVSLSEVRDGRQIKFLFLPDGEDPDSLIRVEGEEGFRTRLDGAKPLSEFLIDHLSDQVDTTTLDGLARLAELAKPLIAQIPTGVYRDMLTSRMAQIVGLPAERMADHLPTQSAPTRPATPRPQVKRPRAPLVGRAISLLLHYPATAEKVEIPENLLNSKTPGMDVLTTLLEELRQEPHLNTAAVLERWREHRFFPRLADLASAEPLIDGRQAVPELEGMLGKLSLEDADHRRQELVEKSKLGGLDEAEQRELKALWAARVSKNDNDEP
ncbi:MAG: DNA primase [Gammaproteobacteria bacterium]